MYLLNIFEFPVLSATQCTGGLQTSFIFEERGEK
jgi:hypothetical protein